MADKHEAAMKVSTLKPFVNRSQLDAIGSMCYGEDRQFYIDKIVEFADRIDTMPETFEQDGLGDDAIVYLHYFGDSMDFYIMEKDASADDEHGQMQAFGFADLHFGSPELGYISIVELTENNMELDLYFEPCTLREVKDSMKAVPQ